MMPWLLITLLMASPVVAKDVTKETDKKFTMTCWQTKAGTVACVLKPKRK